VATDFYSTVNLRFCRGFCGKCVFRCGAFVVELWWNVWQNVVEKRAFCAAKNGTPVSDLFLQTAI